MGTLVLVGILTLLQVIVLIFGRKIISYFSDRADWNKGVCKESGRKWLPDGMYKGMYAYTDREEWVIGDTNVLLTTRKMD